MSPPDIDAIEQIMSATTPGPWVMHVAPKGGGEDFWVDAPDADPEEEAYVCEMLNAARYGLTIECVNRRHNALFIANAREDVPALIAEVRRLRNQLRVLGQEYTKLFRQLRSQEREA